MEISEHRTPQAADLGQATNRPTAWLHVVLLLGILLAGLLLRLQEMGNPLQQDEFGPLYAVVEREGRPPGYTASADMPLVPVKSWQEVRKRSILPYGIENPFPLYHYILYAVVQILPINEFVLRLPSLLAGMGVILGMYFLARQLAGSEAGLAAALLTTVEPMQIVSSTMARPYALATFAGVVSLIALQTILTTQRLWLSAIAAGIHALCTAFIGYMNPILLLIGLPQAAYVFYWFSTLIWKHKAWRRILWTSPWLFAAAVLGGLLMLPQLEYVEEVRAFNRRYQEFLNWYIPPRAIFFYLHNVVLLATFLAAGLVGGIAYMIFRTPTETTQGNATVDSPHATSAVWLGLFVFLLPQVFVSVVDGGSNRSMFMSRYLIFTQLGGTLLFAGVLISIKATMVRWSALLAGTIVMAVFGSFPHGRGIQLDTSNDTITGIKVLLEQEARGQLQDGDAILYRSGFLDLDPLPIGRSDEMMARLEEVSLTPLITLHPPKKKWPCVVVPLSARYGTAYAGNPLWKPTFYESVPLRQKQLQYWRFVVLDFAAGRDPFAQCLLPRLANLLDTDLLVYRDPASEHADFVVPAEIKPGDRLPALHDRSAPKFGSLILIERKLDSAPGSSP